MKIGILGYGNLGRGVEFAVSQNPDTELVAVFTRRNPETVKINSGAKVVSVDEIENWKDKIDVLILCGGSATDLPVQTPKYAKNEWAEFDKYWKLKYWEKDPITEWDNYDREWMLWKYDSKEQVNIKHYNCQAPWGEVVQHGQFVRAYELPYWFTNSTCKVELRLCVDGELKWSYAYQECDYLDVTYEEYNNLAELNEDQRITPEDHGFWAWLKNLFR